MEGKIVEFNTLPCSKVVLEGCDWVHKPTIELYGQSDEWYQQEAKKVGLRFIKGQTSDEIRMRLLNLKNLFFDLKNN